MSGPAPASGPESAVGASAGDRWTPPRALEVASGWSWRLLVVAAAVGAVLVVMSILSVVVVPLALGLVLAAALTPLQIRLLDRGWKPAAASATCLLLVLVGLGLVAWLVVTALVEPWSGISGRLTEGLDRLQVEIADRAGDQGLASSETVRSTGSGALGTLLQGVLSVASIAFSLVSTVLLTLFVLFFYLKDGPQLWAAIVGVSRARADEVDRIGRVMWDKVRGFVRGTAVVALLDAAGIGLGAWALGVPSPGAIFALTFVLAFIPYFGALGAGFVACVLAVADGGLSTGLAMLVVILVVQQVEGNFLQPVLVGSAVAVHPLAIALGVIAGGVVAGVLGMFIAIPVIAAVTAAVREIRDPSTPPEPADPGNPGNPGNPGVLA